MRVTIYRRGLVWWVRYQQSHRRVRRSLKTTNRKVAEDLRIELEYRLRRGELPTQVRSKTLDDFVEEYRNFSQARKRPKSHATDMARVRAFTASLKSVLVEDVETADVSAFLSARVLEHGNSPATVLRYREALHAFFEHAKRLSYITPNPVAAVPRPRIPERDPRFLSLDQIKELHEVLVGDIIASLIVTVVYGGLRREEACWLTWDDLDLAGEAPVLRVRGKTIDGEFWIPKTKKNRTIPVSGKLLSVLSEHKRNGVPWVFPSPKNCRWDPDNLGHRFKRLMKKAGLPWNFLDLRHTFGSQLARKGVSLLKIAKLMGNSPEIAQRHYIHLLPEELREEVEF